MDFQQGLVARLVGGAGTAAILADYDPTVGPTTKAVFWGLRPQGSKMPAITLQIIADPRPQHLKGNDGARGTRVQLDTWAESFGVALALARAAIAELGAPATISGKKFGPASVEGQVDLSEDVNGKTVRRQSVDLIIWHVGD